MATLTNISPIFRCSSCAVHQLGICRPMSSAAELQDLAATRTGYRNLAPNESVYVQGDAGEDVFIVLSGWLFLYQILEDGRRQILRLLMPGDAFGSMILGPHPMDHGAEALGLATICILPSRRIAALRQRHPHFSERVLEMAEREAHAGMNLLTSLGRRSATERVAFLLATCIGRMRQNGIVTADVCSVDLPLSQIVLGDALGLTSIHVNRVLRSLREMNVLNLTRGKLTVLDEIKLARLLGGGDGRAEHPDATRISRPQVDRRRTVATLTTVVTVRPSRHVTLPLRDAARSVTSPAAPRRHSGLPSSGVASTV